MIQISCKEKLRYGCSNKIIESYIENFGISFLVHCVFLIVLPCFYYGLISATNSYVEERKRSQPQVIPLQIVNIESFEK